MTIHLEISNPCQSKFWFYRGDTGWRIGWLWFAFGVNCIRFDELLSGQYYFEYFD